MIIKFVNIKGSEVANLVVDISSNDATKNIRKIFSSFVSNTTAKSKIISYERMTESDFKEIVDGATSIRTLANSDGHIYSNKITRVGVATGTASKSIIEGIIEIYTRKRM